MDFLYGQLSHALVLLLLLFCIPQCAKRTGAVWLLHRIIACWHPPCPDWPPRCVHPPMRRSALLWYLIHEWLCRQQRPAYCPPRQRRQPPSIRPPMAWYLHRHTPTTRTMRRWPPIPCWRNIQIIAVGYLLDKLLKPYRIYITTNYDFQSAKYWFSILLTICAITVDTSKQTHTHTRTYIISKITPKKPKKKQCKNDQNKK